MSKNNLYSLLCLLLFGMPLLSFGQAVVLSEGWESASRGNHEGGMVAGWRVTGSIDIIGDGHGMLGPSHTGMQGIELNGGTAGSVSTNISTTPGKSYRFTFAYSKNLIPIARAVVNLDGTTIHTIIADQTNTYSELNWRLGTAHFLATSNSHELTLQSLESGNAGVYLDTLEILLDRGALGAFVNSNVVVDSEVYVRGQARVEFDPPFPNAIILYTLNGSDPSANGNLHLGAFSVKRSAQLKAIAYNEDFSRSAELQPFQLFILPELLVKTDGGGTVTLDPPDGQYFSNSTATITATPDPGWTFIGWMGDIMSTEPLLSVTVSNTLSAVAVSGTTLSNSVIGSGTISVSPSAALYPFGAKVQATAIPQNSFFVQWGGDATGTNNPFILTLTNEQLSVTALFAALPAGNYSLAALSAGQGRVQLSPYANRYQAGTNVTVTAIADPYQTFVGWTGDATGTSNPLTVAITKSKLIQATFTMKPILGLRLPASDHARSAVPLTVYAPLRGILDLEQSTDLSTWSPIARLTNSTGRVELPPYPAPNSVKQFYRARLITP